MTYIMKKIENKICTLTFNAPKQRNALIAPLKAELLQAIIELEQMKDVKVVIFTAVGEAFCAGGDIKAMLQPYDAKSIYENMKISTTIIQKIRDLQAITIAAVNGHAAGAGFSLALAMDYIVSEEQAKWNLAFKHVGLIPDLGLHEHLVKALGERKAKQWIFEGKSLTASECVALGLINDVVPTGEGLHHAINYAQQLLDGPIDAYIYSKQLINHSQTPPLIQMMEKENTIQTLLRNSEAHYERIEKWRVPAGGD